MKKLLVAALLLFCGLAQAQVAQLQPFRPSGGTVTFTAAGTCPTPVQATTPSGQGQQYIITNIGSVVAFVSFGNSADATANCVIPTSTHRLIVPVLPLSQFSMTTNAGAFFTGITASGTAVIYISPGTGN